MFTGIVYGAPWIAQCEVSCERREQGETRIDPMASLRKVAICGMSVDVRMSCWSSFPSAGLFIDLDMSDSMFIAPTCSNASNIR
jgi:hypothetical protein